MTTQAYDTPTFNQTYQFYRFINANPASALATQFVNAIAAAQSQDSAEAAPAEIDGFFRKTGSYSAVTVDSFLDMSAWLFSKLPAWASFAGHCTYHLKVAGANGAEDVGKVIFNQTQDADYSVTYLAPDGSKTPLYYQAAQLVDDLTADNPAVRLQTSFAALGLFTGEPADAETPVPVLCGTVHGQQSLALPEENDSNGQNPPPTWQLSDIIGVTLAGIMVIVSIGYCIYVVVSAYRAQAAGQRLREQQRRDALKVQNLLQEKNTHGQEKDSPDSEKKPEDSFDILSRMVDKKLGTKWTLEKLEETIVYPKAVDPQNKPINKSLIQDIDKKLTTEEKNTLVRSGWLEKNGLPDDSLIKTLKVLKEHFSGSADPIDYAALGQFYMQKETKEAMERAGNIRAVENKLKKFGDELYRKSKPQFGGADKKKIETLINREIQALRDVDAYDQQAVDKALSDTNKKLELWHKNITELANDYGIKVKPNELPLIDERDEIESVKNSTEALIQQPISQNTAEIQTLQQDSANLTLQLVNQRQKEALAGQLQTQQDQEKEMATKLGSNQELNQCAEQTKKSIKDLNNIDLNSENAATSLEDIAKNADQTQKQLDQLAAANDTEFSNTLNNQLAQDQQISQKDEQDDTNEAEYRNEVNQSE